MTAASFPKALKYLLKDEGGLDDDPLDHGGRTAYGVTQREYNAWRREHSLPQRDVWKISNDEIVTIYQNEYWKPWGDIFPPGLDYLYFDMAVNAGPHRATVLLQRALGVAADGRIGPITRQAISMTSLRVLIDKYTQIKREWYVSLHQPRFTRGWLNRCDHVRNNALAMLA